MSRDAANDNLIDRTRTLWQRRIGHEVNQEDARQIAVNMVGFIRALRKGGGRRPAVRQTTTTVPQNLSMEFRAMTDLLAHLAGVSRNGQGWTARCPAHDDRHNSLSVHQRDGRWLLTCHAGCGWQDIVAALGLTASDLFDSPQTGAGDRPIAVDQRATVQPTRTSAASRNAAGGVTVADYAAAKGLPVAFLKACGISEFTYDQKPALRVPYLGAGGEELAVRFRIGLDGDRFRWESGARPCLYGLHRLADAQRAGEVVLVEGETH